MSEVNHPVFGRHDPELICECTHPRKYHNHMGLSENITVGTNCNACMNCREFKAKAEQPNTQKSDDHESKMEDFTVHCIVVYRSRKDPSRYMMSDHTLSGADISARMETIVTTEASSWSDQWELVSFSHAFLPFKVGYQI